MSQLERMLVAIGVDRMALDGDGEQPSGPITGQPGAAESPGVVDPNAAAVEITADDVAASVAQVKADLGAMATEKAGHVTGQYWRAPVHIFGPQMDKYTQ